MAYEKVGRARVTKKIVKMTQIGPELRWQTGNLVGVHPEISQVLKTMESWEIPGEKTSSI